MDYITSMQVDVFLDFVNLAIEKDEEDRIRNQWVLMLPFMSMKILEYISFNDYKDRVAGKNIDMRTTEQIIADIEEAHGKKVI